jgi:hypothetical protein
MEEVADVQYCDKVMRGLVMQVETKSSIDGRHRRMLIADRGIWIAGLCCHDNAKRCSRPVIVAVAFLLEMMAKNVVDGAKK